MHKTEIHHEVYQALYKTNPVAKTWADWRTELPTSYHHEITNLQREGWPPIATTAKIELDRWLGNI
jgi:hypothetical protein